MCKLLIFTPENPCKKKIHGPGDSFLLHHNTLPHRDKLSRIAAYRKPVEVRAACNSIRGKLRLVKSRSHHLIYKCFHFLSEYVIHFKRNEPAVWKIVGDCCDGVERVGIVLTMQCRGLNISALPDGVSSCPPTGRLSA